MGSPLDEPTTIPGLRQDGQIHLRLRHGNYKLDDLRAALGLIFSIMMGLGLILGVWWLVRVLL